MYKSGLEKFNKYQSKKYFWSNNNISLFNKYNKKMQGSLITSGNKLRAWKRFRNLNLHIKQRENMEPFKILFVSYLQITPLLDFKVKKVAGQLTSIPKGIMSEKKRVTFGIKWAIKLQKDKSKTRNISMEKLAELLCLALRNQGDIVSYKRNFQQQLLRNSGYAKLLKIFTKRNQP